MSILNGAGDSLGTTNSPFDVVHASRFVRHKTDGTTEDLENYTGGGGSGATVHNDLTGRDATDAHPQAAITGLDTRLTTIEGNISANAGNISNLQTSVGGKLDKTAIPKECHTFVLLTGMPPGKWYSEDAKELLKCVVDCSATPTAGITITIYNQVGTNAATTLATLSSITAAYNVIDVTDVSVPAGSRTWAECTTFNGAGTVSVGCVFGVVA